LGAYLKLTKIRTSLPQNGILKWDIYPTLYKYFNPIYHKMCCETQILPYEADSKGSLQLKTQDQSQDVKT
jgi:hypothetical protein